MSTRSRKEQIEEMLALDPNDSFLRYGLAMEYVSAEQEVEAVACLRELLAPIRTTCQPICRPAGR